MAHDKSEITIRELELLQAVADGEPPKAVALHLGITKQTVKNHLSNIRGKMDVGSTLEAVVKALREGLIK